MIRKSKPIEFRISVCGVFLTGATFCQTFQNHIWLSKIHFRPYLKAALPGSTGGAGGKESICQCRKHKTQVRSLGQEDPLEQEMAPCSSILPRRSHGQRSLAAYSPQGCRESDMTEQVSKQKGLNETQRSWSKGQAM